MSKATAFATVLMVGLMVAQAEESRRIEVRGVYLGVALKDIKSKFQKLKCGAPTGFDHKVADLTCEAPSGRADGFDLFGGNRVTGLKFQFIDGKLEGVHFATEPTPNPCDTIATDINQKFGMSSVTRTEFGVNWRWIKNSEWLSMSCASSLVIVSLNSQKYRTAMVRQSERENGDAAKKRQNSL